MRVCVYLCLYFHFRQRFCIRPTLLPSAARLLRGRASSTFPPFPELNVAVGLLVPLPACFPFLFPCHCLLPHRCSSGKVDDCFFLGLLLRREAAPQVRRWLDNFGIALFCKLIGNMSCLDLSCLRTRRLMVFSLFINPIALNCVLF